MRELPEQVQEPEEGAAASGEAGKQERQGTDQCWVEYQKHGFKIDT